jgi:hypothetical protein
MFVSPYASHGQQVEAPAYKDGEWWRIKSEMTRAQSSVSGVCSEAYPEYLVRIDGGKPNVFGMKGDQLEAIDCSLIVRRVLGKSESGHYSSLKFPMHVGLSWSSRVSITLPGRKPRWTDYQYEVKSWEKIKTPKGEFDAFRIERGYQPVGTRWQVETYYYSPLVKAIVHFHNPGFEDIKITTVLVDFNVTQ